VSVAEVEPESSRVYASGASAARDRDWPRDERAALARELHDVVSHTIAAVNLQASVALHLLDGGADRAAESLRAIKDTSGDALRELHGILARMTQPDAEPQCSGTEVSLLSRLERLVGGTRTAGIDARLAVTGTPRELPLTVSHAAYRVAQESLTNVLRHSGAGSAAVTVSFDDAEVAVEVVDDGAGEAAEPSPGSGLGLSGMRDRVQALGGSLTAGRRKGPGFRVLARIPHHPAHA
jgi:signal transduction histidine kinase